MNTSFYYYLFFLIFNFILLTKANDEQNDQTSDLPCKITKNICQINSVVKSFDLINVINSNLTIIIQDSIFTCTDPTDKTCYFFLSVASLKLQNTTLYFPDIHLESPSISLSASYLQTNGTQIGGSGSPQNLKNGVAYSAQGANCHNSPIDLSYGIFNEIYNSTQTSNTFGSGMESDPSRSRGGGRIAIISNKDLTMVNTTINASGYGSCTDQQTVNGGSGGYVWIERTVLTTGKEQIDQVIIDVSGGQGCVGKNAGELGLGGSGGRVILSLEKEDSFTVNLQGGVNTKSDNLCTRGGAGTLYNLKDKTLAIKNGGMSTGTPTLLTSRVTVTVLKITDSALVSFKQADQVTLTTASLMLTQGNITFQNIASSVVINSFDLHLTQSSTIIISSSNFSLISCQFLVDANSLIVSHYTLISLPETKCEVSTFSILGSLKAIDSSPSLEKQNSPKPYDTLSTLIIFFPVPFQLKGTINFDNIYILSSGEGNLALSNIIIKSDVQTCLQETAPPLINPITDDPQPLANTTLNLTQFIKTITGSPSFSPENIFLLIKQIISPIYTTFFFIEDDLQISESFILSARVGVFAQNISMDTNSKIITTGKGCSSGSGTGLINKEISNFCPGSGGSYGGSGGPGVSTLENGSLQFVCDSLIGSPYGGKTIPSLEGSGGGGADSSLLGGRGGGIIVLGMKQGVLDGVLESNGYFGNIPSDSKAGSGSGGSIQIHTLGRLGGSGKIIADGGPQTVKGGGYGGGGRISVNYLGWEKAANDKLGLTGNLVFSAKSGDTTAKNSLHWGSIDVKPCLPGFYGLTCLPCPVGTYKEDFGNGQCLLCKNQEGKSFYNKTGEEKYLCEFECSNGLIPRKLNPSCLSNFDYYANYLGGIYGVTAISASILVLIIFILKKIVFQEKALKNILRQPTSNNLGRVTKDYTPKTPGGRFKRTSFHSSEPWKVLLKEDNFLMEDLPYLKYRFYFKGCNTPYNPWFLSEEPPREVSRNVDREEYQLFCQELNKKCVYSAKWTVILDLLLIIYAPLYLVLLRYLQKRVVKKVRTFLKQSDYNFWGATRCRIFPFCMKLSTTKNFMLGSVEVLDYKKSFDEWDHKDLFPVTIALGGRGTFYHPLQLNLADPIVAGMQLTFNEVFKNDYFQDEFEINLNREEENQEKESLKFLLEFNKLARRIDFGASQEWFTQRVINTINYVDQENIKLFHQGDLNVQWVVEFSSKPGSTLKTNPVYNYPSLQNSLIESSPSVIYYLSQEAPGFSIADIKKIHHVYHYDPTVSLQFSMKVTYKYQNKRPRSIIKKEKGIQVMSASPLDHVYQELEPNILQLKDQLFDRLEKQGNVVETLRDIPINDDASQDNEYQTRDRDLKLHSKGFMAQVRRFIKVLRYLALGYRLRVTQKYILTVLLLLLLVLDLTLLVVMHIFNVQIYLINIPFPLAVYMMPIGGIFWIAGSSSISLGKTLLTFNVMAIINLIQAIIFIETPFGFILAAILVFKTLTVPFGCQYVSYLDSIKDTVN